MTEADKEWKAIIESEKCKTCMYFKKRTSKKRSRCENPNRLKKVYFITKEHKACKDYDQELEGYFINIIYI